MGNLVQKELPENPNRSYKWSTGETSETITVTAPGRYRVTVTDCAGCSDTDEIEVSFEEIHADAGPDMTINKGDQAILTAQGGDTYLWSTGETTPSITVNPMETTIYKVQVWKGDCSDSDEVKVTVMECDLINLLPIYQVGRYTNKFTFSDQIEALLNKPLWIGLYPETDGYFNGWTFEFLLPEGHSIIQKGTEEGGHILYLPNVPESYQGQEITINYTDPMGCTGQHRFTITIVSEIDIEVSPVPVTCGNDLTIHFLHKETVPQEMTVYVEIFNQNGQMVQGVTTYSIPEEQEALTIQFPFVEEGIFAVRVSGPGFSKTKLIQVKK